MTQTLWWIRPTPFYFVKQLLFRVSYPFGDNKMINSQDLSILNGMHALILHLAKVLGKINKCFI